MRKIFVAAMLAAAATVASVSSVSAATYFYGGFVDPTNSRDGGAKPYVGLNAPMTFTFTTAAPIAASANIFNDAAAVLWWEASAGQPESTIDSTDAGAKVTNFHIITDATGAITSFFIGVHATNPLLGGPSGTSPTFLFDHVAGGASDTVKFIENAHGQNTGGVDCSLGGCSRVATSFIELPEAGPAGVLEPASWALMIAGFGGAGVMLRRRRTAAGILAGA